MPAPEDGGEKPAVTVLLAVSGGPDSMAMASMFAAAGLPFAIAHCNFHLRGAEGDEDTVMVRRWARANGVRFHRADFDTEAVAAKRGISVEMAARELRYAFFAKTARREGYPAVAAAHHRDDNAETMLLNLLRGTGVKGLSGMRESGPLPVPGYEDILLIRPLLSRSRDGIMAYLQREHVPYRLDSTNAENHYKRNRLRNQVFPIFRELNPSFINTLVEDAGRIASVAAIADDYFKARKPLLLKDDTIDIDALMETPHWEYLLYRILAEYGFSPADASMAEDLLKSHAHLGGKTLAGGEKVLIFAYGKIVISSPRDFWDDYHSVTVEEPGTFAVGDIRFSVSMEEWKGKPSDAAVDGCLIADAGALEFPIVVRNWKRGDYMRPLGLKGRKKIQDVFTDLKLSLEEKHDALLVEPPHPTHGPADSPFRVHVAGIMAPAGKCLFTTRIDERFRVRENTTSIIRISIIK